MRAWADRGRTLPGRDDPEWVRLAAPPRGLGDFFTTGDFGAAGGFGATGSFRVTGDFSVPRDPRDDGR
ncbi:MULTISPECIES: hypothetical protein [Streptomyces]|nr:MULTISPECIES: hypothetical protein [Streptomyces]MCC8453787.1 hypothetical protein [Streptomyces rochei]MDI3099695.1 hypothetical protein [Streptomyces sp. AN-3]UXI77750.1 hypothetical protein N6Q81_06565 [Streptomyces vinaceusdrappus]WQC11726.1 hypothetical protein TR631_07845 [Streptomyces rochei]